MTDKPQKLTIDQLLEFLEPVLDISTCDQITLTKLKLEHKEIVPKLRECGRPVVLRVDGHTLLLCDAHIYLALETRRKCILSGFKTVEDALSLGQVDREDPRIVELQSLKERSSSLEVEIKDSDWSLKEAKKELSDAYVRIAALSAELKASQMD
jgi:hypothetical protein